MIRAHENPTLSLKGWTLNAPKLPSTNPPNKIQLNFWNPCKQKASPATIKESRRIDHHRPTQGGRLRSPRYPERRILVGRCHPRHNKDPTLRLSSTRTQSPDKPTAYTDGLREFPRADFLHASTPRCLIYSRSFGEKVEEGQVGGW